MHESAEGGAVLKVIIQEEDMKITVENFEEAYRISIGRMLENIASEVTEPQKSDAHHRMRHIENNRNFYLGQLKRGFEVYMCSECGALECAQYVQPTKDRMLDDQTCFHCDYWKQFSLTKDPKRLVINGHTYTDGGNQPHARNKEFLGFGGQKWFIERAGQAWETNNLWSGSVVPQRYIENFPDNARFLKSLP